MEITTLTCNRYDKAGKEAVPLELEWLVQVINYNPRGI